jgi:hypothetical protein
MPIMASAATPGGDELREIARRLCDLVDITLPEPIDVGDLREVVDDPRHDRAVRYALSACADALAAHELPPEIRRLRAALEAYLKWLSEGNPLRKQVVEALSEAGPALDEEARARAEGEAEATAQALTDEQRADGYRVKLWPSPEALDTLPHEVFVMLQGGPNMLGRLLKVLDDLPCLEASPEVVSGLIPIKIRIAKILKAGGYKVAEIATVTEPYAKSGPARRRAQNTVRGRLKSITEEMLYTRKVDPSLPNAAALAATREAAAMFVAGVGSNVVIFKPDRSKRPGL